VASAQAGAAGSVAVSGAAPGRLSLDVSTDGDGLLVVSQPFYPGWQARIDGEQVAVHRVDTLLQGVPVRAGSHRVELSFHLSPLPALVSLAALLACLAGLILKWRRA